MMRKLTSQDKNNWTERNQKNLRHQLLWKLFQRIFLSWICSCDAHWKISFPLPHNGARNQYLDSLLITIFLDHAKLLVSTTYNRPQFEEHMQMWIEQMKKAFDYAKKNKIEDIVFLGDCNARHWSWGDTKYNSHRQILYDNLKHLVKILNNEQLTFLFKNGNCVINLCILQGWISNSNTIYWTTVDETELFIDVPLRVQVPVIVTIHRNVKRSKTITKPWFEKADWNNWSKAIDFFERIVESRLRKWLKANNSISPTQEGFRPKNSTVRSLYHLNLLIEKTFRKQKPAALRNIDMEKLFDSVWKRELSTNWKRREWLENSLPSCTFLKKNRIAFLWVNKYDTSEFKIETGLTQGSISSRVLFGLCTDDFLKKWESHLKFAHWHFDTDKIKDNWKFERVAQQWHWELVS